MFYYSEDGHKFTSKIEALIYQREHMKKISFYYYDDVYSQLDWKTEPSETLDYYYKEQAQRIRDNYDYVILCYSGGYDSTNILETFHFNNIKLDKIITVGALSQDSTSGVDENHNGELYHNVFPYIKELGLESITQIIDYTSYFTDISNFSIAKYKEDWVDNIGPWYSPHNWFWNDIEKYIIPNEWKGKRIALIFGKDKPTLFYNMRSDFQRVVNFDRQLNSFCFRDTPCMSYASTVKTEDVDRINFYWDPGYPNILIKQLHVINKIYQINLKHSYTKAIGEQNLSDINVSDIVYNLRKKLLFKSPKSKSHILSLRDNYLLEKKNSDIYELYNLGINKLKRTIGSKTEAIATKFYDII
jgi:hypothetical protein